LRRLSQMAKLIAEPAAISMRSALGEVVKFFMEG